MKYLKVYLTLSIAAAAFVGDYIVFKSKLSSNATFRALSDGIVHATIGFLSSLAFFSYESSLSSHTVAVNVFICTIISSFIDLDHVFMARSFKIKDLTNLKNRGIFHCTTFWLIPTALLLAFSFTYKKDHVYLAAWMCVIAVTSHHLRDGNRRGLWLYPYGHSPPINKYLYVILTCILPYVWYLLYKIGKPYILKKFVETEYVTV